MLSPMVLPKSQPLAYSPTLVSGCKSWYLDSDGDPILWPYTFERWEAEMAEPAMSDFDTTRFDEDNPELRVPELKASAGY